MFPQHAWLVPDYPRIPYGESDFRRIRRNGWLYVDKTRFIRRLEEERYVVLIRPRRFGKSCWVSLLENYYDRRWKDEFDTVFGDTEIGRDPTGERHAYVSLRFDFSVVKDAPETLEAEFEAYCHTVLKYTLQRHPDLFPEDAADAVLRQPSVAGKLNELFVYASETGIPLYALIDEYDNFANTILAHRGEDAYHALTHGSGFYRNFFAVLKGATARSGGGLERLFVTGVSPITMDDVTSGFNIGKNISLEPDFNEIMGLTGTETRGLLELYRDRGALDQGVDDAMALMGEWYNGYRFAKEAEAEVYNTDMVLYYLDRSIPNRRVPDELIDMNVRIDYGKLRHLLMVNRELADGTQARRPNGNFDVLRQVIAYGEADSRIVSGFPLKGLSKRENFLSLLHYFGLLSIRGAPEGVPRLGIPNQTVRRLMYGYLRDAWEDMGVFALDFYEFERLMHEMAYRGDWRPVMARLADAVARQTGIRDYITGEKVVQSFFAAYFGMTDHFELRSEHELNKGYADLYLAPRTAGFPGIGYGFVLEFKYMKRSDRLDDAAMAEAAAEASAQLHQYLSDDALTRQGSVQTIGLAVVFHGWEMVSCEAVDGESRGRRT